MASGAFASRGAGQPNASETQYAAEPASTGTASGPVPMIPSANKTKVKSPASGRRASAAPAASSESACCGQNDKEGGLPTEEDAGPVCYKPGTYLIIARFHTISLTHEHKE